MTLHPRIVPRIVSIWTSHDKSGHEFTLAVTISPLPPSMFEEVQHEDEKLVMIPCTNAHQIWKRYGNVSPSGDIYRPTDGWWLLVTSLDETAPVAARTLYSNPPHTSKLTQNLLLRPSRYIPWQMFQSALAAMDSKCLLPGSKIPHVRQTNFHI